MELEYKEIYEELFQKQDTLLELTLKQKKFALHELAEPDAKVQNIKRMKTMRKIKKRKKSSHGSKKSTMRSHSLNITND